MFCKTYHNIEIVGQSNDSIVPAGDDGSYVTDCSEREEPMNVTFNFGQSIAAYVEYAMENLVDNMGKANLEHLLNELAANQTFDPLLNLNDLINEFNSIEKQYFHLHKKIDFTTFYQELKGRIERYVARIGESGNERKLVKLLYTAVISKLSAIRKATNHIAVIRLLTYIDTIQTDINKLKEITKVEYIMKLRDDYKRSLDEKIKSANEMVRNMVTPAIDKMFNETERNIQQLLNEAVVKQNETEKTLIIAEENKEKLRKSILWHSILAPFKLIGGLIGMAGPQAAVAGVGNYIMSFLANESFSCCCVLC